MEYSIDFKLSGTKKELKNFEKSVNKLLNSEKDRSKIKTIFEGENIKIHAEATDLPALKATYNSIMQMFILYEQMRKIK